ncbi:MAG: hypothetical protein KF835_13000 [Xanthobacteraceae bacterium]|nr:hypothetical protein [Xanthobacteraceae bacterium]
MNDSTDEEKKNRRAKGRLSKYIDDQKEAEGRLPLVHITRSFVFEDIIDGNHLEPQHCKVFNEKLLYFFYGRPAFRPHGNNNGQLEFSWPIVFVVHPDKIAKIRRVMPFDSGAFAAKLYEEYFDKDSRLSDFILNGSFETVRKIVGAFNQDHNEYFFGGSRKNVEVPHRQYEVQGLHELSRNPAQKKDGSAGDERSSTIEIQISDRFDLSDALLAIILPTAYLDDADIRDAITRWNVPTVLNYDALNAMPGQTWSGQIYQIIIDFYRKQGFLR